MKTTNNFAAKLHASLRDALGPGYQVAGGEALFRSALGAQTGRMADPVQR